MSVILKSPEDIEKMRVAGRLAAEVLDYIGPLIKPGMTTAEVDRLCHLYMIEEQGATPAPLNYAPPGYQPYPKSVCTSVNHVVCHGVPGDKKLKPGDIVNVDITVIKDGFHVVREFCGHGIGRKFHEDPQVLHYGRAGTGLRLEPGMIFTVEPMINA